MLITFSGLDGAGKSTLIEWLKTTLEQQDRRVVVFHMNDHVGLYAYLRVARDTVGRIVRRSARATPEQRQEPAARLTTDPATDGATSSARRVRNAIVWSKTLRRFIYPVDLLVFLGYRLYIERIKGHVLVMDRYFYDTLVDVSDDRGWAWVRLLERITPTPTLPIYLDITPEESYARKGEYTVPYLRRRWTAYRRVFPWIPSSVTVPTTDFETSKRVLERAVMERVAACEP